MRATLWPARNGWRRRYRRAPRSWPRRRAAGCLAAGGWVVGGVHNDCISKEFDGPVETWVPYARHAQPELPFAFPRFVPVSEQARTSHRHTLLPRTTPQTPTPSPTSSSRRWSRMKKPGVHRWQNDDRERVAGLSNTSEAAVKTQRDRRGRAVK